jgi:hypothetical protein
MTTRHWRWMVWVTFLLGFGLPVLGAVGSLLLGWSGTALFDLCWAAAIAGAFGVWSRRSS